MIYYYKRLPIRDHVEKEMAAGRYAPGNAYGLVATYTEADGERPVTCGCGGSNWLCQRCAENLVRYQRLEKNGSPINR